jgi:hypothetical protein
MSREIGIMRANSLLEKIQMGIPMNLEKVGRKILEAEGHTDIDELMKVQPPSPPLEDLRKQAELEHRQNIDFAKLRLDAMTKQYEAFKDYSQAVKNLASAESLEAQNTLAALREGHVQLMDRLDRQLKMVDQMERANKPSEPPAEGEAPNEE